MSIIIIINGKTDDDEDLRCWSVSLTHAKIKTERANGNEIVQVRMCDYVTQPHFVSGLRVSMLRSRSGVVLVYTWAKTARLAETMQLCQHSGPRRLIGLYW